MPLILALVADVFLSVPIESTARRQGFRLHWIENQEGIPPAGSPGGRDPGQAWVDFVARMDPALLLVDLNHLAVPWQEWIRLVKTSPATAAIPVVCFGPHVRTELFTAAREAGADAVLARSRFLSSMGEVLEKYGRQAWLRK